MIRRSTWIMLIIFLILVALAIFWERSGNSDELIPTATLRSSMINLGTSSITGVEIRSSQGQKISFEKNVTGDWAIEEPLGEVDPNTDLGSTIEQFISVRALSELETSPPTEATGLNQPDYTVTLSLQDSNQRMVKIGKLTVTGSGYYVQVSEIVYVIDKFTVDNFLGLLQNPPYITPEAVTTPDGDSLLTSTATPP